MLSFKSKNRNNMNITMMLNQEKGKEGVKKQRGKGGYSAEGL